MSSFIAVYCGCVVYLTNAQAKRDQLSLYKDRKILFSLPLNYTVALPPLRLISPLGYVQSMLFYTCLSFLPLPFLTLAHTLPLPFPTLLPISHKPHPHLYPYAPFHAGRFIRQGFSIQHAEWYSIMNMLFLFCPSIPSSVLNPTSGLGYAIYVSR